MARLAVAAAALVLALGACIDATGPATAGSSMGTGTSGGGSSASHDERLLGRWSRTLVITTDTDAQSSQTIWEFRADGSATRTVITLDLAMGVADTLSTDATWSTSSTFVTIAYLPPAGGTVTFAFTVSGSTLTLGSDQFTRIG